MNMTEVAQVAIAAGLRDPVQLPKAVAIAFAESTGNPRAHNGRPPDDSYGLWQINMLGSLGPARRQQFGIGSNDALYDPATNAKAMMAISGGGHNWQPWTTYNGLRYFALLPPATVAAEAALAGAGAQAAAGAAADVAQSAAQAATLATKAGAWLANRNNWLRIAKVAVGVMVLGVGVSMLNKPLRDVGMAPIKQLRGEVIGAGKQYVTRGKGKTAPAKTAPAKTAPAKTAPAKVE